MFIRIFIQALSKKDSKEVFDKTIEFIKFDINECFIEKNEPYWKIDGIYVIEANIDFVKEVDTGYIKLFLESISNKWKFYGNPVDEALASLNTESTENTKFYQEEIEMVNVFYDNMDG